MPGVSEQVEWLSLVDISGPFLAATVLEDVFPQGLEKIETPRRQRLRAAYDEWRDAVDEDDPELAELHAAWIRMVLQEALEYEDEVLVPRDRLDGGLTYRAPEHGVEIAPDFAVRGDDGKARLLIAVHPPETDLEKPLAGDRWPASPVERMTLLCRANDVRVGLVTDGERWMVVNAPVGGTSGYATWLARLWWQEPVTFRAFVSLLGVRRCFGAEDQRLDRLLEKSIAFQEEVTDTLGEQVRRAVEVLIQALGRADQDRNGELLKDVGPAELYEAGLTVMMRLVFLLCAEERGLLLLGDPVYDQCYAISTLRAALREEESLHGPEVLERRYDAWSRMLAVFRAVYGGIEHETLRLPALGGSLFDPDRFPFLEGRPKGTSWHDTPADPLPIDNRTVLLLLTALQVLEHRGGAQLLSYRALDVEQIGHVYEGLLEYTAVKVPDVTVGLIGSKKVAHPVIGLTELESLHSGGMEAAVERLAELTGRSASAIRNALQRGGDDAAFIALVQACAGDEALARRLLPFADLIRPDSWGHPLVYRAGSFAVARGADRRETGTHYTPRSLTETIVEKTLEPIVYEGPAEGRPRDQWRLKSPVELLDLKICDPAMGSGAFLVQACRYLSERLVEAWGREEDAGRSVTVDGEVVEAAGSHELLPKDTDERLLIARRLVAERCLYGVDLNPLAVELAKLSIWLTTMAKGRPFAFLDHNLRCGDSLLGIHRLDQLMRLTLAPDRSGQQQRLFGRSIEAAVAKAVELRTRLRQIRIRDIRDVEAMAHLHEEARDVVEAASLIADALIGEALRSGGNATHLARALDRLAIETDHFLRGDKDAEYLIRKAAREALAVASAAGKPVRRTFHWPLEFPEVFRSADQGFDVVIGNPPYVSFYGRDSQAAKHDTSLFESYASSHLATIDGHLALSGRINTFLLFIVRATHLAPAGPRWAFVLPDTIITNESYAPMRQVLTRTGRVRELVRYRTAVFGSSTVGTAVLVCGTRDASGTVRLADIPDHAMSGGITVVEEPCQAVSGRMGCSWLPVETRAIVRAALPSTGTIPLCEVAHVKDGINPGPKATRKKILTNMHDGDPSLRLCMEGGWITPFRILKKPLWVRYAPSRLTDAERKAGASLRQAWIFDSTKIVYRQTASRIIAAIDTEGLCALNSVHSIVLKKHDDTILHALLAFLNSDFCRDYYQAMTGETRKVFPQVHISSVKTMRIPRCLLDPQDERTLLLASLSRKISVIGDASRLAAVGDVSEAQAVIEQAVGDIVVDLWRQAEREEAGSEPQS